MIKTNDGYSKILFNPERCCSMYFSTKNSQYLQQFEIFNWTLKNVDWVLDMRVYVTSNLSVEIHWDYVIKRARLYMMKKYSEVSR